MNKDLISREAAIKIVQAKADQSLSATWQTRYDDIARILRDVPAVDAEPVQHGKWIYNPNANDWGIGGYVCSECHAKNDNLPCTQCANPMIFMGSKYCPNCRAKMDLED